MKGENKVTEIVLTVIEKGTQLFALLWDSFSDISLTKEMPQWRFAGAFWEVDWALEFLGVLPGLVALCRWPFVKYINLSPSSSAGPLKKRRPSLH